MRMTSAWGLKRDSRGSCCFRMTRIRTRNTERKAVISDLRGVTDDDMMSASFLSLKLDFGHAGFRPICYVNTITKKSILSIRLQKHL